MTSGRRPLGRRLLAAFTLVALASVLVLTIAALVGSWRGLDASETAQRQAATNSAASAAGGAYLAASGWAGADLSPVAAIADAYGAQWVVRDASGEVVGASTDAMGMGMGRGGAAADVVANGSVVGSTRLLFGAPATTGQVIAWSWILLAALVALAVAVVAAVFTTRWITAPVRRLSEIATSFADGDRNARPGPSDLAATTELGDLARAFAAAADDVARSEAARRRMTADVAHELRTPLAALQAGLEELRDGLEEATPDRVAALHEQSLRLGRIVDDLAVLSEAESAALSMRRDPVDLGELADEAVSAARPEFTAAGITLHVRAEPAVEVIGDAVRLHQVLGNLLGNAARYCRPGDHVEVQVRSEGAEALLIVSDDGPGITAADLPHVFDRLQRGTAQAGGSGSGIGLAVVRGLAEAHGGAVSVASDGSRGSTFTVRLPLA